MKDARRPRSDASLKAVLSAASIGLLLSACEDASGNPNAHRSVVAGDAAAGRALAADPAFGCGGCHLIPGIAGARGVVGPPLAGFARRSFIAGSLPHQPSTLVAYLENPPRLVPGTGMPRLGLTQAQARDLAAFLYTLDPPR